MNPVRAQAEPSAVAIGAGFRSELRLESNRKQAECMSTGAGGWVGSGAPALLQLLHCLQCYQLRVEDWRGDNACNHHLGERGGAWGPATGN